MLNDRASLAEVSAHGHQQAGGGGRPPAAPREPLVVIEPSRSWASLNLRDLWDYRELLYFLAWRDIKVRYKQTVLGMAWVVFQPLLMTFVFTAVFGSLVHVPTDGVPYPLFAYAGLMLWTFFSGAVSVMGNCLLGNAQLITKVHFPRLIIPLASITARLVDFGVSYLILVGMMAYYRVGFTAGFLLTPPLLVMLALLALGFGMWTSAVYVRYRDVGLAIPVLIQLWMFVSPIVYPLGRVPEQWRLLYSLNPLVGIVETFRSALFGTPVNWPAFAVSAVVTPALLVYAAYAFRRRERTFADVI